MATTATVTGTLTPEGRLELDSAPDVPPGRVTVTVQSVPIRMPTRDIIEVIHEIWARREARDAKSPTGDEVDAYVNALRDENEERSRNIEALQDELRRQRQPAQC